jgi:hypothetical protein
VIQAARVRLRGVPLARTMYRNVQFMRQAVDDGLWRVTSGRLLRLGRDGTPRQEPLTWNVTIPGSPPGELRDWLRRQGCTVEEGKHTLYLPPQAGLADLLPSVVRAYPATAGFKILKDFRSPGTSRYLTGTSKALVRDLITGPPADLLLPANYLHARGLGPRVWDLSHWHGDGRDYTVFVVDHVDGRSPRVEEFDAFQDRLTTEVESGYLRIPVPDWRTYPDFRPPDCRGNLLVDRQTDQPLYVDFQNFAVLASSWTNELVRRAGEIAHFGDGRPLRDGSYLYQRIPGVAQTGKRNTERRWNLILDELDKAEIALAGRTVLDFGCNSGMMLHAALSVGAGWAVGWDRPAITAVATELLSSLGTTRFALVGCNLDEGYDYLRDIPSHLSSTLDEAVVFYLAVRQHVGILQQLTQVRWRALVYEGHQGEQLEQLEEHLQPLLEANAVLACRGQVTDGYSSARPFAILLRR